MNPLVVIGTSVGGVEALRKICADFPGDFIGTLLIVMHIGPRESNLPEILSKVSVMPVRFAQDGQRIEQSMILIAPPDQHLLVCQEGNEGHIKLTRGPKENFTRPAIDPLFRSAAAAFGRYVAGIVLTGYLDDGTIGLQAIKACGGLTIVQDPAEAFAPSMPISAIENVEIDHILQLNEMGPILNRWAAAFKSGESDEATESLDSVPAWIKVENKFPLGEDGMDDLRATGAPSMLTCPECGGTLWQLEGAAMKRFRCHTGHGFTAETLAYLQERTVEETMWTALRILHEQETLANQLSVSTTGASAAHYLKITERTIAATKILKELILSGSK